MDDEKKSRYASAGLVLLGFCVAVVASAFLCGCDSRESDDAAGEDGSGDAQVDVDARAKAQFDMGAAYAGLGRWGEAIDAYQCVLHIEPNNTRAQFNIGVVHLKAGRYAKAIGAFGDIFSVPRVSYRTVRLEADDYVLPEYLPDNEADTKEYVRGRPCSSHEGTESSIPVTDPALRTNRGIWGNIVSWRRYNIVLQKLLRWCDISDSVK